MEIVVLRLVSLIIGYGFGCIQTAYIIGKIVKKVDVREHGSGNAGTSNVIRVIGHKAGAAVFVCDVLKAIAAFVVCALIFNGGGSFFIGDNLPLEPGLYAGLGVLLGHNFPFYLRFKGGKGIASTLGIMLALDWQTALAVYVVGFCVLAFTRYISLTSLVMATLFPLLLLGFNRGIETVIVTLIMTAMAFILHRGNILRLISGTERKLILPGRAR